MDDGAYATTIDSGSCCYLVDLLLEYQKGEIRRLVSVADRAIIQMSPFSCVFFGCISTALSMMFAFSVAYAWFTQSFYGTPAAPTCLSRSHFMELAPAALAVQLSCSLPAGILVMLVSRSRSAALAIHISFHLLLAALVQLICKGKRSLCITRAVTFRKWGSVNKTAITQPSYRNSCSVR